MKLKYLGLNPLIEGAFEEAKTKKEQKSPVIKQLKRTRNLCSIHQMRENTRLYNCILYTNTVSYWKKIPHTGDIESLDRCGS